MNHEKIIFCANCQIERVQVLTVHDKNIMGEPIDPPEIVATCVCGRQLKFPGTISADEFEQLLQDHKQANEGQQPAVEPTEMVTPPAEPPAEPDQPETLTPPPVEPDTTPPPVSDGGTDGPEAGTQPSVDSSQPDTEAAA